MGEMGEAVEYNVGEETEEGGEGGGKHGNGEADKHEQQGGLEEFSDSLLMRTCIEWRTKYECDIIHASTVKWVIVFLYFVHLALLSLSEHTV